LYLLLVGELPSKEELTDLQNELKMRSIVPEYVWTFLKAVPKEAHPMALFSAALTLLENESIFRKEYDKGMKKEVYWEYALEDSLDIIAKLPAIAAGIYRIKFNKGELIPSNPKLDWAADYIHMLGLEESEEVYNMMRLYMTLHTDHEGGNVSAFTSSVVGSALSDPYYSLSAGLNGLAGPLHGLANQECLRFVLDLISHFEGAPTDEQLRELAKERLDKGLVIPGYGHAVLRVTDPRFTAFLEFGKKYFPNDDKILVVEKLFHIIPQLLIDQGKAKDPWPNVDASSGALLYHYGIKEFEYYTVLFGVSRALGICSQIILSRAVGFPITRPKSITLNWLEKAVRD
jgi:citrate synthase